MTIKSNTKDFILKSTIVHNNRYDYSESEYITNYIKLKIRCLIFIFQEIVTCMLLIYFILFLRQAQTTQPFHSDILTNIAYY